jgi:hypothetical protein
MRRTAIMIATIGCLMACGERVAEPDPSGPVVSTVVIASPSGSIFRNDTLRLTASVRDQNGAELSGKTVAWSSSNSLVASVDSSGRVIGLTAGQVAVTAAAEGKSGAVQITVVGPGTEGAVAGSATIDSAGGAVNATLPGGGALALNVPAGALASAVQISLDPVPPGPASQASFQISPAGLRLSTPATLVVKVSPGARVRPTTVLVFEQSGRRIPVPSVANPGEGTVTATLGVLGAPEAASGAALRVPSRSDDLASVLPGGVGSLLDLTVDQMIDDAFGALNQLKVLGTFPAADAMQLSMDAVVQAGGQSNPRFGQLAVGWRTEVCNAADFANNALANFGFVSDYPGLARVIGAVIGWGRVEDDMTATFGVIGDPGCLGTRQDPEALILTTLSSMQAAIRTDLNGFVVDPAPRDSVFMIDRLSPLLNLVASLQAAGFDGPADVLVSLVSAQFIRLRFVGYTDCRLGKPQEVQGRLMRLEAAGGVFAAVSPYDVAAIEQDIELCGMDLRWKLLDSTGSATRQGTLGGGASPGNVSLSGSGIVTGEGGLEVSGTLNALRCPAPASANAEQFEVVVGTTLQNLTRIAILTPSNQNTYLAVSPLHLTFDALRAATGIAQDGAGQIKIEFRRIGGNCGAQFVNLAHSPLGTLTLSAEPDTQCPPLRSGDPRSALVVPGTENVCAPPLAIATTTLPGATVGSNYLATLQASGGSGSYQWSLAAGQFPPGLTLGGGGSISGTPTTAGTFTFTVQVVSGTGTIQRALTISVTPPSALLVWHFDTDLEGWTCSSTTDCKWQLLSFTQFPQTSGWVALQDIGEAVSRNIALPSNARFLRFDASTHNVPGDVSRVQVQVGGVTVLDQTFVNPGSNTAFNFVTMTIDISARAGQTVNIRFVQGDDGQGNPKTLKIDNISISPN